MTDKTIEVKLIGNDIDLRQKIAGSTKTISAFGSAVHNTFSGITRAVDAANKTFGTFGKIVTAFGSGVVLKKLFSLEEFMKVDDALLMMQANLKMNARELDGFKNKLSSVPGRLGEDMGEVFRISAKLSKGFKPDDILKIVEASSLAAHAMEEDLTPVSERIVQIMRMYHKTPDEARAIAEALSASNVELQTLDILLQRGILKGGAGKDFQEVLAMASALKKAGADSPRIVMSIEAIMNSIEENQRTLKSAGIDIFKVDPKTGKKVRKDIVDILQALQPELEKARKRFTDDRSFNKAVDETFGAGAHEAIPFLISQIGAIKKAKEEQGNAAQITADRVAKAEEKWSDQLEKIKGHLAKIRVDLAWIFDLAKKPVKFLGEHEGLTKGLGYGAAGLSIAVLGGMAYGKGKEFLKNYKGTARGIAEGKVLEAAAGVTPVFVTNWPGNMNGGMPPGDLPDAVKKPGLWPKLRNIFTMGAGAIVGTPAGVGSILLTEAVASAAYWKASSAASASLRQWRTSNPYDYAKSQEVMGIKPVNHIHLNVNIDKTDRVSTDSDDMNTSIDIERGGFFADWP